MTEESRLDSYFEALREDLPSSSDEARIRKRLAGAGVMVTLAATGKTAAAGSTALGSAAAGSTAATKLGLVSALSIRFASLPLLAQLGVVTAGTAVVVTGPVAVAMHAHRSSAAASQLVQEVRANAAERHANPPVVTAPSLVATPPLPEQRPQQLASPEVNPPDPGNNRVSTLSVVPVESLARSGGSTIAATESPPAESAKGPITSQAVREMGSLASADLPQNPKAKAIDLSQNPKGNAIGAGEATVAPALRSETLDARNLSEETRLIDHALAAIRAGDLSLATRLLDEHAARFPHARLGREQQRVREKLNEARNRTEVP